MSSDAAAAAAARQPPPPLPPPAPLRFDDTRAVFAGRSSLSLLHSLAVFRACTVRPLVSHAPALLAASRRVLGDGATAAVLRRTFFAHFCAGEDEAGLEPTLARLRAAGVGAILDFAAEADVDGGGAGGGGGCSEAALDANLAASLRSVRAAGSGFAAVKLTSLAAPDLLRRVSALLQRNRRAFRRFNAAAGADPYSARVDAAAFARALPLPPAHARALFALLDSDGDGELDYLDFYAGCAQLMAGGAEAAAVAAVAGCGGAPAALLAVLAPPQLGALDVDLDAGERARWRTALARAHALGAAAAASGAAVMVDAEQSYMQAAIDWAVVTMQRRFNRPRPPPQAGDEWLPPEAAAVWRSPAARAELDSLRRSGAGAGAGAAELDWSALPDRSAAQAAAAAALFNSCGHVATQNANSGRRVHSLAAAAAAAAGKNKCARAVVYNTHQAYLVGTPRRLALALRRADREGWLLGSKLVRGAYMVQERALAAAHGYRDPVHADAAATHACYAACADELLRAVDERGAEFMAATHNEASVRHVVERMAALGLRRSAPGVAMPVGLVHAGVSFGQLLGMCDHISFSLAAAGCVAFKYTPYGPVLDVAPYLIRRAQENADVLGAVGKEMRLLLTELRRRARGGA